MLISKFKSRNICCCRNILLFSGSPTIKTNDDNKRRRAFQVNLQFINCIKVKNISSLANCFKRLLLLWVGSSYLTSFSGISYLYKSNFLNKSVVDKFEFLAYR